MENAEKTSRRSKRGSVMVIAALAMVALLLFAALAIDVGVVWSSRTQSQNVSDAAALAAASKMILQTGTDAEVVRTDLAETQGAAYAASNYTVANPSVTVDKSSDPATPNVDGDFEFGKWDFDTRTLDTSVDLTKPELVTGVRVKVRMDNTDNKRSPAFLSRLLGRDGFNVENVSTAYLGFEGGFEPGEFDLPVAIDSCKISVHGTENGCEDDRCGCGFCQTVASPPSPCPNDPDSGSPLRWPQGNTNVTCLEFSSTPQQNACWTVYDDGSPSVNNPDLHNVVDNGNSGDVRAGDDAYADNGDKTATQTYIRDLFYGCNSSGRDCCADTDAAGNCIARTGTPGAPGQVPAGMDRYGPNPVSPDPVTGELKPGIDSWVVKLPVFECDPGRNCSGGDPMEIIGGVCFEIREILAPAGDYNHSSHKIKGRFLCPNSPDEQVRTLYDTYCADHSGPQDGGGCPTGQHAQRPVLVK